MIDAADSNTVYYYHFDGVGSVIALSDVNSVIVERYSYDVFGKPSNTSDVNNPYLFTGRRYDDETGLYYYRARYYDYTTGRFLQTDPLGYHDDLNVYSYCWNNPIMFVDPSGMIIKVIGNEKAFDKAIKYLLEGSTSFQYLYEALDDHHKTIYIKTFNLEEEQKKYKGQRMEPKYDHFSGIIYWDPSLAVVFESWDWVFNSSYGDPITFGTQSPALVLAHEIMHALQHITDPVNYNPFTHDPITGLPLNPIYGSPEDERVITGPEADVACDLAEDIRPSGHGTFFPVNSVTDRKLPPMF